jgi:hypothetical protein
METLEKRLFEHMQDTIAFNLDSLKRIYGLRLGVSNRFLFNERIMKEISQYSREINKQSIDEIIYANYKFLLQELMPERTKINFKKMYGKSFD